MRWTVEEYWVDSLYMFKGWRLNGTKKNITGRTEKCVAAGLYFFLSKYEVLPPLCIHICKSAEPFAIFLFVTFHLLSVFRWELWHLCCDTYGWQTCRVFNAKLCIANWKCIKSVLYVCMLEYPEILQMFNFSDAFSYSNFVITLCDCRWHHFHNLLDEKCKVRSCKIINKDHDENVTSTHNIYWKAWTTIVYTITSCKQTSHVTYGLSATSRINISLLFGNIWARTSDCSACHVEHNNLMIYAILFFLIFPLSCVFYCDAKSSYLWQT